MQVTLEPMRSVIGPTCNEWSFTYLSMMVFIWAPLPKRTINLYLFTLTLVMFLAPYQHWKGSGFKKGVCEVAFTPQEPLSGGSLWWLLLLEGSRLPLLLSSPPSHLTVSYLWRTLQADNYGRNVQGCYNGNSISHLLGHPSLPLPNEPWTPQSPPQFHQDYHSLDPHHHRHPLLLNVPSIQQAFSGVAG